MREHVNECVLVQQFTRRYFCFVFVEDSGVCLLTSIASPKAFLLLFDEHRPVHEAVPFVCTTVLA